MSTNTLFNPAPYDVRTMKDIDLKRRMLDACMTSDRVLVMFSGGKDSTAALLFLLESGVPSNRIEIWHQCVDGRTVQGLSEARPLMDYPCTEAYVAAVARELNVPAYFQWRDGGFEGEMLRRNAPTARTFYETPEGIRWAGGGSKCLGTRRKFPMQTSDLSRRWCSASLKIDVASLAIRNQKRFKGSRTVYVSGERAEESASRARYADVEFHRTHTRHRHLLHWRPVLRWAEAEVWDALCRHGIRPHPCYFLHPAIGRCSCQTCIFASAVQWRIVKEIDPDRFTRIAAYEREFGCTIVKGLGVEDIVKGVPCPPLDSDAVRAVMSHTYAAGSIRTSTWILPPGAFGDGSCGAS